ncbi:SDR family oxidoreductase [Actinopolymorpha sp. B17G11]|uniref:SDR family oxidoreductase n=1 Tax=Actinopolymorpha sp. B17G11 TaxID=3160861 RepID=UPI0032E38BAC
MVRAHAVSTDVGDHASTEHLVEEAVGAYGRLDIAVNNAAGAGHSPTLLADVDVTDYDRAQTISLRASASR